ncbi:beta-ketoacyl-ACP synthase III [Streptomyces aidingensis]|uniref:3-oxoacyl-[acyl-carrier-protein] synthase-3 n=1 Tax=Streptomyces aidingensis TaxID=910347 RepID=A0A1I1FGI9_9ACTN|nr:beta-ketoacyl-ACP synthase III [Streptomyces aidingensis]SFB98401.1 3-oxoacyl-[acyl-carrier-protein] synthase-3 [Streptomyces aidingensis]
MITRMKTGRPVPGSRILGIGAYRPTRLVGNETVAAGIDSSDEWIRKRSGITTRRFAGDGETVINMAVDAGLKALAGGGVAPEAVDVVLLATMSHLEQSPPAAPRVAHGLGAATAGAMDIGAACAGFCYALGVADSLIRSGAAAHVVVVGSERMSDLVSPADRGTAFLFGDGAGAVVLGPADEPGIGPVAWGAEGGGHGLIAHSAPWTGLRRDPAVEWPTLRMAGPEVFRWAVHTAPLVARRALERAGLTPADIAAFVPHQANARIIDAVARELRLAENVVVAREVVSMGNTSAASVPLALEDLTGRGEVPSGGRALLVGFGAGLVHAAQVVTLP